MAGLAPINSFAKAEQVFRVGKDGGVAQLTDFTVPGTEVLPTFAAGEAGLFFAAGRFDADLWRVAPGGDGAVMVHDPGNDNIGDLAVWRDGVYVATVKGGASDSYVHRWDTADGWVDGASPVRLSPETFGQAYDLERVGDRLLMLPHEYREAVWEARADGSVVAYDDAVSGNVFSLKEVVALGDSLYAVARVSGSVEFPDAILRSDGIGRFEDVSAEIFGPEYIGVRLETERLTATEGGLVFVAEGIDDPGDGTGLDTVGAHLHLWSEADGLTRLTGPGSANPDISRVTGIAAFATGGPETTTGTRKGDRLKGTKADEILDGKAGRDRLDGRGGDDTLLGGGGNDTLRGAGGGDVLDGGGGRDRLAGGNGADALSGGGKGDVLAGGRGDDRLDGGKGRDVFVFDAGSKRGQGMDEIADFDVAADVLRFAGGAAAGLDLVSRGGDTVLRHAAGEVVLAGVTAGLDDLTVEFV